jgi:hypothetical protein
VRCSGDEAVSNDACVQHVLACGRLSFEHGLNVVGVGIHQLNGPLSLEDNGLVIVQPADGLYTRRRRCRRLPPGRWSDRDAAHGSVGHRKERERRGVCGECGEGPAVGAESLQMRRVDCREHGARARFFESSGLGLFAVGVDHQIIDGGIRPDAGWAPSRVAFGNIGERGDEGDGKQEP